MKSLEVIIHPDGTVSLEVKGMKGTECEQVREWVKEYQLGEIVRQEYTSEYYEQTVGLDAVQRLGREEK